MAAVTATYTQLQISYENAQLNVEKNLTFATLVTHPEIADKKSYPIRWQIVLLVVLPTLFLLILVIYFVETGWRQAGPHAD